MTFMAILLNVLVPILVVGVISYLINLPDAPISARGRRIATWVLWVIVVLWILYWALAVLHVFAGTREPLLRER